MPRPPRTSWNSLKPRIPAEYYGDRMQKIVFIGRHMDVEQIKKDLDFCIALDAGF